MDYITLGLARLVNTSFSLHRVSPLHVGSAGITRSSLDSTSQRLHEYLVGDVVRGVQIGTDDGGGVAVQRAGSLVAVKMDMVGTDALFRAGRSPSVDLGTADAAERRDAHSPQAFQSGKGALWVDIQYNHATFTAVFFPPTDHPEGTLPERGRIGPLNSNYARFPLLLARMPASLRATVFDFLSSCYDCRFSDLKMGTGAIISIWESSLRNLDPTRRDSVANDVVISLGFQLPHKATDDRKTAKAPGLKSLDIIIAADDVTQFVKTGHTLATDQTSPGLASSLLRAHSARRKQMVDGLTTDDWPMAQKQDRPFTEALASYIDEQLAINIFNPCVQITKIACPAFALSGSRIKMFRSPRADRDDGLPPLALRSLIKQLVDHASRPYRIAPDFRLGND